MSFWNLFNRKKSIEKKKTLSQEIKEEIAKTLEKKNSLEKEVTELNKWALELINKVFTVPKEFWYQELALYQKIKGLEVNININSDLVLETDSLIRRYKKQIEFRTSKITFYDLLRTKYEKALVSALKQEKLEENWAKEQVLMAELDEHKKKIRQMENKSDNLLIEKEMELKNIRNNIRDKVENLAIEKRVFHDLNQLSQKIENFDEIDNDFYQNEIERIIKKNEI